MEKPAQAKTHGRTRRAPAAIDFASSREEVTPVYIYSICKHCYRLTTMYCMYVQERYPMQSSGCKKSASMSHMGFITTSLSPYFADLETGGAGCLAYTTHNGGIVTSHESRVYTPKAEGFHFVHPRPFLKRSHDEWYYYIIIHLPSIIYE